MSTEYDPNGNLIHYKGWDYTYDAQNRLRLVHSNQTLIAEYYYDGKNRQIARKLNGTIRFSVWDGWELLEEYDKFNVRQAAYLQGATGVIKSLTTNIYYYQDKLGSTTHVANASGTLVESYRYDLYGTPTYFVPGDPNARSFSSYGIVDLYAGERWVGELGLYDLRNRFLSSELGRFLQADPLGMQIAGAKLSAQQKAYYPAGQAPETFASTEPNLYRYCHNDPINKSDPFGLAYVSGLTGKGGGDWVRGFLNITNREQDLINQARLHDFLYSEKTANVARDAARASYSTNVEHGAAFGNKGPNDIALGPTTASTDDPEKNVEGRRGVFNTTDFTRKPLPRGYTLRGGVWGLARHQDWWPTGDRRTLWNHQMSGVLGIPAQGGSQNRRPEVLVYEYVPGSAAPPWD